MLSTVGRHFAGKPLVLIACCVAILGCRDNYYPLETYYPLSAFQNCIEGVVIFDVLIDVDGNIKEADVISSHPAGVFEEAATKALQLKKFDKTGEEYRTDRTITYSIEDIEDCRRHYGVQ
ncbi:MAG: energy transducer TonB [Pseudomonadota bacterium]